MGRTIKGAPAESFPLNPREFAARMDSITGSDDRMAHADADRLMSQQLRGLGFGAGATSFDRMERRYVTLEPAALCQCGGDALMGGQCSSCRAELMTG